MDNIDVVLGLTFLEAYNEVFKGKKRELSRSKWRQGVCFAFDKIEQGVWRTSQPHLGEGAKWEMLHVGDASWRSRGWGHWEVELVSKCDENVLKRYQDVMPEDLPNELPPRREVDHKIEVEPRTEPPSKAPYRLSQKELEELKSQWDKLLAKGYKKQS